MSSIQFNSNDGRVEQVKSTKQKGGSDLATLKEIHKWIQALDTSNPKGKSKSLAELKHVVTAIHEEFKGKLQEIDKNWGMLSTIRKVWEFGFNYIMGNHENTVGKIYEELAKKEIAISESCPKEFLESIDSIVPLNVGDAKKKVKQLTDQVSSKKEIFQSYGKDPITILQKLEQASLNDLKALKANISDSNELVAHLDHLIKIKDLMQVDTSSDVLEAKRLPREELRALQRRLPGESCLKRRGSPVTLDYLERNAIARQNVLNAIDSKASPNLQNYLLSFEEISFDSKESASALLEDIKKYSSDKAFREEYPEKDPITILREFENATGDELNVLAKSLPDGALKDHLVLLVEKKSLSSNNLQEKKTETLQTTTEKMLKDHQRQFLNTAIIRLCGIEDFTYHQKSLEKRNPDFVLEQISKSSVEELNALLDNLLLIERTASPPPTNSIQVLRAHIHGLFPPITASTPEDCRNTALDDVGLPQTLESRLMMYNLGVAIARLSKEVFRPKYRGLTSVDVLKELTKTSPRDLRSLLEKIPSSEDGCNEALRKYLEDRIKAGLN